MAEIVIGRSSRVVGQRDLDEPEKMFGSLSRVEHIKQWDFQSELFSLRSDRETGLLTYAGDVSSARTQGKIGTQETSRRRCRKSLLFVLMRC
jgi:hypothetical protein